MSLIGVVVGSALAVLEHPRWLVLALAGFLVRGGVLLLLLPIVQVPTTAAMANLFGPTLVGFVFGGVSVSFLIVVGSAAAGLLAWIVLGGLAGATIDLGLIRETAATEDLDGVPPPVAGGPGRVLAARLLSHVPTLAVMAVGVGPLVDAVYQELIHPGDPALSVPVRVVLRVPEVVGSLVAAWILGEAVGGLAARHLAWGAGVPRSLLLAIRSLLRPVGLIVLVLTDAAVVATAALAWLLLAFAFEEVRTGVREGLTAGGLVLGFTLLSIAWLGAAWLLSLATAWRSAAWTYAVAGRAKPRTIGSGPA